MSTHCWLKRIMEFNPAVIVLSAICAAFFLATVSFACLLPLLRLVMECRPGQIDGQCGLGTLAAWVSALLGSLVVWVGASFGISIWLLWYRRSSGALNGREPRQRSQRLLS
jgi:hypothetical protein